ncbi:MAG: hypothetical protein RIM23_29825 [Coleofasciculus sp. G3-WIS-01]|uniref:hypothetical protein n=1 Tax=Coleofasciculus sp. G3-WIS-01 TaxID=3069528 RepID=UPI003302D7CF
MDNSQQLPDDFIKICQSVTAKRPRAVIDHIMQYGFVTTEELKETYGYNHPPRAARDVRELGIPLKTFRVTGSDGRKIAAYKFGDISNVRFSRVSGRTGLILRCDMRQVRRLDLLWQGDEIDIYERLKQQAIKLDKEIPEFVKEIIEKELRRHSDSY